MPLVPNNGGHIPFTCKPHRQLDSRTLGGQTRLELCKIYQYPALDSGFAYLTERLRSQFVSATGAGFALWRWNIASLHTMTSAFITLYVTYAIHSMRHCNHQASLAFLLYSIFTAGGYGSLPTPHVALLVHRHNLFRAHSGKSLPTQPTHPM